MTRINAGIPPSELSDKHLLAEHREIKRIGNAIRLNKANTNQPIPKEFVLGKGHVIFFYDKMKYIANRYSILYNECINRGFNVTDFSESFLIDDKLINFCWHDWTPTKESIKLIRNRIKEKTKKK